MTSHTMPQSATDGADLIFQGETYARVPPGVYQAVCTAWQGPQWVRPFHRWSVRLNFALLDCGAEVSRFLNLGNDPMRKSFGRRSNYFKLWCQANGEMPRKGQQLACSTFVEPGLLYTVRVVDAVGDDSQKEKPDALVYSKVKEVLRVDRP